MGFELKPIHKKVIEGKICPYCSCETEFVDSIVIFRKSYGMVYYCAPCQAWVGVHNGTKTAKGRLANANLRQLKKDAHLYFDKIWQLKIMSRSEAYAWLSRILELPGEYTHIGMFSEKTCADVVYFSKQLLNDNRRLDLDFGATPETEYFEL